MNYAYDYYEEDFDKACEVEMDSLKADALEKLAFIPSNLREDFALMLAYSCFEEHAPAIRLAEKLHFEKEELLAFSEDYDAFQEEFRNKLYYTHQSAAADRAYELGV